jgi:hypothetical protein
MPEWKAIPMPLREPFNEVHEPNPPGAMKNLPEPSSGTTLFRLAPSWTWREEFATIPPPHQTGNRRFAQASGRKVRAPQSAAPANGRGGGCNVRSTESATEKIPLPPARGAVRVKRRGKSSPPGPQGSGHGKPCLEQDRIGRKSRFARLTFGFRLLLNDPSNRTSRGMIASTPQGVKTEPGLQSDVVFSNSPSNPD